jgi:hypothetical protein
MLSLIAALLLAAPSQQAGPEARRELAAPVKVLAGKAPIDVEVGHAAPCVADLGGDGKLFLLVGQFGEGKLRVYPNVGSKTQPRFEKFEYLHAGAAMASVPSG